MISGMGTPAKWMLIGLLAVVLALLALPAGVRGQDYQFETNGNAITITKYIGAGGAVTIPAKINGLSVTSIGDDAFYASTNLTRVVIPASITNIENRAFSYCPNLTSVIFIGNAPRIDQYVFDADSKATIIYIKGTTGWGKTFGGRPTTVGILKP